MKMITVGERCQAIATFRFVSVWLMETVARWTPTTPEMEAKVMFGRHIWDFAQMADALGKRTFELRQPMHFTLRPVDSYSALLQEISEAASTENRVSAVYQDILPSLVERYNDYRQQADPILDEPTVVIVDRITADLRRQCADARALQAELKLGANSRSDFAARACAIKSIVAPQPTS